MGLATNLVAYVKKTGSPFDEFFTGATLDMAAGGTAAVLCSSFGEEGERVSPGFSL
jgi:hypothetical protein